jgi:hypothetical protein
MTVDLSSIPRLITMTAGEGTAFALPSYAGGGYDWSATCVRGQHVAEVTIEMGPLPKELLGAGNGTGEPPPLTMVSELVVVHGLASGDALWRLALVRPFGPPTPLATHDLEVIVGPATPTTP